MDHLKILSALINLIIGTWAIFFIMNTSKVHPFKFLQPLVKYTLVYNLMLGLLLFSEPATLARFFFVGLIIVGILGLKMASAT